MKRAVTIALCALALAAPPALAARLRIAGDRLSLAADAEPLGDILSAFARQGITVRADPALSPARVTANVADMDIEKALSQLLEPFDYVLLWKQVRGPIGPIAILREIRVFRPDHEHDMRLLPAPPATAVPPPAAPSPGRALVMADDLLVRAAPGASQAEFLALVGRIGGRVADSLPESGIYRIRLAPGTDLAAALARLGESPLVSRAEPNYAYRAPFAVPSASIPAPSAASSSPPPSGARTVAVLDTGLRDEPALGASAVAWYDAVNASEKPEDPVGHGTLMALLAAGAVQPGGSGAIEGPPPSVLACRVFDSEGLLSNFDLMRALRAATAGGARVLSLSWGSESASAFLEEELKSAADAGLVILASAGNEPDGKPFYPAAYPIPSVLAVSAALPDGRPWSDSNRGAFVDLCAPATATVPGEGGASFAGTSIAAAYAAGVLGRYLQLHPDATAAQAIERLKGALTDAGDPGRDDFYGAGLLDDDAVRRLLAPQPGA